MAYDTADVSHNARYVVVGLTLWAWKALPWVSLALFVHCQRDSIRRSLRCMGGWLPFWYKLSLNYLNSIRVAICCAAERNRKCISGLVMAVLKGFIIFLNCIGCEERTAQAVRRQAAKRRSQKWLQKIHLLFYAIAVAGFAPVGALQWLLCKGMYNAQHFCLVVEQVQTKLTKFG